MPATRKSAVRSGVATGLSSLAVAGSAAGAGVLLAHFFGRNERTDGLFVAYGVYLVLSIAAQSFRTVVLPQLTREAVSLGGETVAYLLALAGAGVVAVVATVALAGPLGRALTAHEVSAHVASRVLPWLVAAGFLQLVAALAASALAARDSYEVAALAYAAGAVVALVLFAALHSHGEVSLAWALTANGAVTAAIPLGALGRMGVLGMRARGGSLARLGRLATGAAVPIALQAMFVVALRLAAGLGTGKATSLNYAYLIAAVLVVATASSVALISSAPLTRRGIDVEEAITHVVHSSWLSLALIAAAAGVFALAGGRVVGPILGGAYGGEVGRELGQLVAYLAPWMVVSVAFTLTYPLLFVLERSRGLVAIAIVGLAVSVPIILAGRELAGLGGIAGALAVSTGLVLAALLVAVSGGALWRTAAELGRLALQVAVLAALAFGLASLLGGFAGAAVGLVAYAALLAALRPRGLREAWSYVRALH
jgi:O-antigen/teichoic acid export membrane protein